MAGPHIQRQKSLPFYKRAVFSLIPAILIFSCLEVTLRIFGFEFDTRFEEHPIFVRVPGSEGRYRTHPALTDPTLFDYAFCVDQEIALRKPPETIRVALVGESSVVLLGAAQPLADRLEAHFGRRVEVLNFGFSGTDSRRALRSAEEAMRFSPDFLIVYSGHNEFISITNPATRLTPTGNPAIHQWNTQIRVVQLFEKSYARYVHPSHEWIQLRGRTYTPEDKEAFYERFESNLNEIVELARQNHVEVILSTLAWNYAVYPTAAESYERYEEVHGLAKEELRRRLATHANNAFLEYALGVNAIQAGRLEDARQWFNQALLHDRRPQIADPRINDIVARIAKTKRVAIADVSQKVHHSSADDRLPDFGLFLDHCHLNHYGQQIQFNCFADAIAGISGSEGWHPHTRKQGYPRVTR